MTEQQKVAEELAKQVQERVKSPMLVTVEEITKNNGVQLTSITGRNDGLGTNVYVDQDIRMIMGGEVSFNDVAAHVAKTLESQAEKAPFTSKGVIDILEHPDPARITMRVVNREQNLDLLKTVPHRDIHSDLSIIASYKVAEDASTRITNDLAARMGYTATEVIDHAIRNANHGRHVVQSMRDMLAENMGISAEQADMMFGADDHTMLVVTNESKLYGAGDIFVDKALREKVAERIGGDFYIIPSSVHEVICVNADAMSPEQAAIMIQEVNANEVRPEEVLGSHPYHVNTETLKISNPCAEQAEQTAKSIKNSVHM